LESLSESPLPWIVPPQRRTQSPLFFDVPPTHQAGRRLPYAGPGALGLVNKFSSPLHGLGRPFVDVFAFPAPLFLLSPPPDVRPGPPHTLPVQCPASLIVLNPFFHVFSRLLSPLFSFRPCPPLRDTFSRRSLREFKSCSVPPTIVKDTKSFSVYSVDFLPRSPTSRINGALAIVFYLRRCSFSIPFSL